MSDPRFDSSVPEPIPPLRDPELTRPSTWLSVPRADEPLWLDKNENLDPELAAFNASLLASVDSQALRVYPEAASLYAGIARWCGVKPESLLLTPGSDGAIRAVFQAFTGYRDRVVHTVPTFAMYPVYCRMFGVEPVPIEYAASPDGPSLDVDRVLTRVEAARPKLLCLPNPDSPTGTIFGSDEMEAILAACERTGTVFLVDEAYHPFHPATMVPMTESHPHLLVARSFSKAWGLAGIRMGYLVGHPRTIAIIHKLRPMYEVGALSIAVMDKAIRHPEMMEASVSRLEEGRAYFVGELGRLGYRTIETRGNFQHVAFGDDAEMVHRALEGHVLYRKSFSEPCLAGFSRFSLTTREQFQRVVAILDNVKSSRGASR